MNDHPTASITDLQLPVEIIGSDLEGQQFIERTETLTVTRDGATIFTTSKLAPESEVILRNPKTNEEASARVVGQIRRQGFGHVYGFAFLEPSTDLWHVQFAPGGPAKNVPMACSRCQTVFGVSLSHIEQEVFDARQELTRFCKICRSYTIWKQTDREVTAQPPVQERQQSAPQPSQTSGAERRKSKRTAMKVSACIRHSGAEEIVTCEDVSRGGLRFTGSKQYPERTRIEVAVPYTKSSVNIFSPATIVYCQKLSQDAYRHGVSYIAKAGWADRNSGKK